MLQRVQKEGEVDRNGCGESQKQADTRAGARAFNTSTTHMLAQLSSWTEGSREAQQRLIREPQEHSVLGAVYADGNGGGSTTGVLQRVVEDEGEAGACSAGKPWEDLNV